MINEKQNNNIDWRDKLGKLTSIQGEVFDKEISWNKLHEKLYSKSNNRKAIWYWLAAACLFFALLISIFLSNKKENVLVKNNSERKTINYSSLKHAPLVNKDASVIVSSSSIENKMPVHSTNGMDKIKGNINYKAIQTEIVQNKKEQNITIELSNNAEMPVDTVISIVANLPEKKKLKVVHINELGDPVSETPNIARYNEQHSFQFKFMNEEVYTKSSPSVNNTGFKIFATKSISTN
jgi:hypothetical protein